MPVHDGEDGRPAGGKDLLFIVASAAVFLAIAVSVVYFVCRIIL
jgi:hypothetical protein